MHYAAVLSVVYEPPNDRIARVFSMYIYLFILPPVPVAPRSKAQVCGRSPAEIVGSSPTESMDICCDCCVLSGRGLCDGLITRPEESCGLWCVVV